MLKLARGLRTQRAEDKLFCVIFLRLLKSMHMIEEWSKNQEGVEGKVEPVGVGVDVSKKYEDLELSPEEISEFWGIILAVEKGAHQYSPYWRLMKNYSTFWAYWNVLYTIEERERLLDLRKKWVAAKKGGAKFEKFFMDKIRASLDSESLYKQNFYFYQSFYKELGYKDAPLFLSEALNHKAVWSDEDGSNQGRILDTLIGLRDPRATNALVRHIEHILSEEYRRKELRDSDLGSVVRVLYAIHGDKTAALLQELAENDQTFDGWFQKNKLSWISKKSLITTKQLEFEPFDPELEKSRIQEIEKWLEDFVPPEKYESSLEDSEPVEPLPNVKEWEGGKFVNFYGRFIPQKESCVEITAENYPSLLFETTRQFSLDDSSLEKKRREYFSFIFGFGKKGVEASAVPEDIGVLGAYRACALAYGRALVSGVLEHRFQKAVEELEHLKKALGEYAEKVSDEKEISFFLMLSRRLGELQAYILRKQEDNENKDLGLPESAEAFILWHPAFSRCREVPDFLMLLKEKIGWYIATDLAYNISEADVVSEEKTLVIKRGPSFRRITDIATACYDQAVATYKSVTDYDVPIYWEASEKLDELRSRRNVVFGRDGRYLFTALKAFDLGSPEKKHSYVILTTAMRYPQMGVSELEHQRIIAEYLRQRGVALDFMFIDTGYAGSIPEFAIKALAESAGVTMSDKDIDQRIKLLNSSRVGRGELSKIRRSPDIGMIEGRPKTIVSPQMLTIDEKKRLRPKIHPNSVFSQLQAWVVEHAVMRNFVPKLNTKHLPLEIRVSKRESRAIEQADILSKFIKQGVISVEEKMDEVHGRIFPKEEENTESINLLSRRKKFSAFIDRFFDDTSFEKKQEMLNDAVRLYEVSRDIVGPVVYDFAKWVLSKVDPSEGVFFLARDGLGPWIVARLLVRQGKFPQLRESQLKYAYLSRKIMHVESSEKIKQYLTQLGITDDEKRLLMADVGVYGAIHSGLKHIYPRKKLKSLFLISRAPGNEFEGFLSDAKDSSSDMNPVWHSISGNKAVHFLEDTFSGFYGSTKSLETGSDGKIRPKLGTPYSREVYLKRLAALTGLVDIARLGSDENKDDEHQKALEEYLANGFPKENEHLMVPHE